MWLLPALRGHSFKCVSLQAGQIIDIRSMINEATRLNVEEGSGGGPDVSIL